MSVYLRRKSEGYLHRRRRSDDHRTPRQPLREESTELQAYPQQNQITTAQVHIEPVKEENETRQALRQSFSRRELLKHSEDFL